MKTLNEKRKISGLARIILRLKRTRTGRNACPTYVLHLQPSPGSGLLNTTAPFHSRRLSSWQVCCRYSRTIPGLSDCNLHYHVDGAESGGRDLQGGGSQSLLLPFRLALGRAPNTED